MNASNQPMRSHYEAPTVRIVLLSAHDIINSSNEPAALAEMYGDAEFADGAFVGGRHVFDEGHQ